MSAKKQPVMKKVKIPTMAETQAVLEAGKWSWSKPKPTDSGHNVYPRNDMQAGGPTPTWVIPRSTIPFVPGYGKFKTDITNHTNYDMELSIRDDEVGRAIVAFYTLVDEQVYKTVEEHSQAMYNKQMSPAEADFKHRKSLIPNKKTGGFPYLLRTKCHPGKTKFWVVVGVAESGKNICRMGTVDDILEFSEALVSVEYKSVYGSPMSYGSTYFAKKVIIWPPVKRGRADEENDAEDNEVDDLGDDFEVAEEEEEVPEEGDGIAAAADARADAGANDDNGDDEPDAKRTRTVPDDDEYANSDDE
jgi:hypothetical protein